MLSCIVSNARFAVPAMDFEKVKPAVSASVTVTVMEGVVLLNKFVRS